MKRIAFASVLLFLSTGALVVVLSGPGWAGHDEDPRTKNLHPMGHIIEPASLVTGVGGRNIHTDIAFWGQYAFQGSWLGFDVRDISKPGDPKQVSSTICTGEQGDIVVWDNILVRSWNSPASLGSTCGGQVVPVGFEGLHIFEISDPANPVLIGALQTPCGSHTATAVPDTANDRLLIYSSGASASCPGFDIIEVPLSDPASATFLRTEVGSSNRSCHDTAVILGDAMLAACAGDNGFTMWALSGSGSLEDPYFLHSILVSGVNLGNSVSFTWDGKVVVFGHEPGGGVQANCQLSNPDSDKSVFFFNASTGAQLGMWTLPRAQSNIENCTIRNFNTVPTKKGGYILVSGNYQSGTSVVDFTDPANPKEIAFSDPPPIPAPGGPFCGGLGCEIGGAWASYWYNNFIYETNITEGLNIFRLSGKQTAGALKLDHLNPQTQEFTLP